MTVQRYNSVAIILHWLMAIAFILMLLSGVVMVYADLDVSFRFQLYQWHKSLGVLLLVAFVLRIIWRLVSKVPELPSSFTPLMRISAKIGHWSLYAMMILMPLSGWVMVSSSGYDLPTMVFGWFEWPHIPGLEGNEAIEDLSKTLHWVFAITFAILIAIHWAAVIKHTWLDGEPILKRIWWSKNAK